MSELIPVVDDPTPDPFPVTILFPTYSPIPPEVWQPVDAAGSCWGCWTRGRISDGFGSN